MSMNAYERQVFARRMVWYGIPIIGISGLIWVATVFNALQFLALGVASHVAVALVYGLGETMREDPRAGMAMLATGLGGAGLIVSQVTSVAPLVVVIPVVGLATHFIWDAVFEKYGDMMVMLVGLGLGWAIPTVILWSV